MHLFLAFMVIVFVLALDRFKNDLWLLQVRGGGEGGGVCYYLDFSSLDGVRFKILRGAIFSYKYTCEWGQEKGVLVRSYNYTSIRTLKIRSLETSVYKHLFCQL